MALEVLEAEEAAERCPACGTREQDWRDSATGKVWAPPRLAVEVDECRGCAELDDARLSVPSDRRSSTRFRFVPFDLDAFLEEEAPASSDGSGVG